MSDEEIQVESLLNKPHKSHGLPGDNSAVDWTAEYVGGPGRRQAQIEWMGTQRTGVPAVSSVQSHSSISLLVGHIASLTSIFFESVACGYYNLICKPLHGSYVRSRDESVAGEICAHTPIHPCTDS